MAASQNPFYLMKKNFAQSFFLPGTLTQQPLSDLQKSLVRKLGVSMEQVVQQMQTDQQVIFGRYELYTEETRAIDHWMVGAATKLYAEFVTNYSQMHESTVWVTSDSPTYEKEIRKLFDTIGLEEKIFDWAYSIAAFGDLFIRVNAAPGVGIISVEDDDHPLNISRVDIDGVLAGFYHTPLGFVQTGTGEGELPILPPWEYIHFRLLGARKRRNLAGDPMANEFRSIHLLGGGADRQITSKYGTSLIVDALSPYKRLRLAEDSVLLARLTRGIMRYIYKIKVDSTNMEAVASLMDQYVGMLKHARSFDTSGSGFFDSKANPFCLRGDTKIHLCGGSDISIQELSEQFVKYVGKCVWSVNPETQQLEAKKLLWAGKTRQNAQLLRVHLDNEEYVDCTPDHKFMLRDGSFQEAQNLQSGQSLMPFYSKISQSGLPGYECVYNPADGQYHYAHKLVMGRIPKGYIVHHKDYNKKNNDPSNLIICTKDEHHNVYHKKHRLESIQKIKENQVAWLKGRSKDDCVYLQELAITMSSRMKKFYASEEGQKDILRRAEATKQRISSGEQQPTCPMLGKTWEEVYGIEGAEIHKQNVISATQKAWIGRKHTEESKRKMAQSHKGRPARNKKVRAFRTKICACGCGGQFVEDSRYTKTFLHGHNKGHKKIQPLVLLNHKVVRVEWLNEREDTYDIQVEGNHNFALSSGVVVHNSSMEDILLPVWNDAGDIAIEKIGGDPDIRWIVDVTELRNQLACALKCPLALLGAYIQEASGQLGDQAIEQLDIGFAKNSRRLQRTLIEGLTRLAQIHIAYMNMDPDPEMFTLHMSQTSTAEEESLKKALDTGMDVVQKLLDVLSEVAPELDKKKLFNFINQKILKLEGLDLAEFQQDLREGKLPPETINRISKKLVKVLESRGSTRKEILASTDLRSYLPITERCQNYQRAGKWIEDIWRKDIQPLKISYKGRPEKSI